MFGNQAKIDKVKRQKCTQALKPEDPFNFSHCTGVRTSTLHVKDFIYTLNLDRFLTMSLELILVMIKKYVMVDLCNWANVKCLNKTFYERYTHIVTKIEWVLWF